MSWSDYWKPLLYHQWFTTLPIQTKSFSEQTIIVTGSTRGLGLEAARLITNLGAKKVILAVRNIKLGETVRDDIEKKTGKEGVVEVWPLDLCSYESVKEFAEKASKLPRIDVLLLNAAIYKTEFTMAEVDETTITTNIVSNFLLGLLLLPKLKETSIKFNVQPTLEIVTSEAHWIAEFTEKAILIQYSSHLETKKKVVNVFNNLAPKGYPVIINLVNPGLVMTGLVTGWLGYVLCVIGGFRTASVGARALVNGASFGPDSHGEYLSNCRIDKVSPYARREEGEKMGEKLWAELSEKLEMIQPGISKNL